MIKKIIGMKVFILPLAVAFSVMFAVLFVKPVYSDMMTARKSVETNRQQLASLQNQMGINGGKKNDSGCFAGRSER
ncbi:MAG: hypothetical protein COZ87_02185 [Candidatus Moranbacteria bacterium CG_4_8_14_3_um_filter_43_15]|nr:MAG: hypothetical protein COZ87_02185 [Candidatus Moranbacteria bacterium CG_4_8_14_3_um_filter_43_15]